VSCLGHSDAEVRAALHDQLDKIAFAHTGFFTSDPAEALADLLIDHAPDGIDRVYLVSGGSEAVEAALKLARQYFMEIGQPQRRRVIARRQSYHGNTLGALATGGNEWRRAQFAPLLMDATHIAPATNTATAATTRAQRPMASARPTSWRRRSSASAPTASWPSSRNRWWARRRCAVPAVPGYLKRIREICDRHGVLLILDEVMCGMGRTGYLFACEEDGVAPDMITIAKGLGAGYQPIGALLTSAKIYDAIKAGSGFFQHGHTYMGHAMAAAGAKAVIGAILNRGLLPRVREQGEKLDAALRARFGQHPHVGDIRGRGLFRGLELVSDRETKVPFDPTRKLHARIKAEAFAAGLICYPMGGTIDGVRGDHILLAPPFIIEDAQIDELTEKLGTAIDRALAA
jgi:adenosylmethionine-8-amino-7-oxononanoate aminotransferase